MADRVLPLPPPLSPSAEQIEKLRALALAAISGYPMDTDECTGAWKAWFNFHGDPHVVEDGESSGVVAVVSTAPLDYGKARAEFMGAADPLTLLSLLDSLAAERALRVSLASALQKLYDEVSTTNMRGAREIHGDYDRVNAALFAAARALEEIA